MNISRIGRVGALSLAVLVAGAGILHADAMVMPPDAIEWGPVPPILPEGAEMAVVSGNPMEAGQFVVRLRMPEGYTIPPHTHSMDENVTVLSGELMFGAGETMDKAQGGALPEGGYASIPAEMAHYAWVEAETTVQIHGDGPFDIRYIDPADDPQTN